MNNLTINEKEADDILVITPVGRIDVQQMVQLRKFFESLKEKSFVHVTINMADVTFIDSYGVSVLTNFSNQLKLQEGLLTFYNCRKEIGDFLKIAGVNQIIPILETFDDVKEHFQG